MSPLLTKRRFKGKSNTHNTTYNKIVKSNNFLHPQNFGNENKTSFCVYRGFSFHSKVRKHE